jgi:hypothetical protein
MYFVLPLGLPCCLLYNHLLFNATLTPLCPPLGVGVDGAEPNTLSSRPTTPLPDPKLHLLLPATVALRTSPLAGLPENDPPDRSGLPVTGLPDTLRPNGELPTVAALLLEALTARGVLRTYRGGVTYVLPGVGGVASGESPRSVRWRGVRGMSERSSFGPMGRSGRKALRPLKATVRRKNRSIHVAASW